MSRAKLARAVRYLGDKVVDVLMYIIISSLIAGLPYLIAPTLTPAQVFFTVAFAAFIAMVLVALLGPYLRKAMSKEKIVTPMAVPEKVGLEVYTRAEVEQKFPFVSFVSQVKRGGELVIMSATFLVGRYKTETIKRLITEHNVTVTILLLAPVGLEGTRTGEIESEFKWQGLSVEIEQTLVLLCRLRRELKELKDRLIIRTYDRVPILSLIVIDPNTEDAIMQVGTYLSGTDASARLVTMVSKKTNRDVFDNYWAEYLLMRSDDFSKPFNCKEVEHLISS